MSGVLFVAEIGSMHKGDRSLAYELIRQAKQAGANVAKFQFGWPREDRLRHVDDWAEFLADACAYHGIELMASLWGSEGLAAARAVDMRRYKIAYQKRDDEALINEARRDMREIFISGYEGPVLPEIRPIFCVSKYPCYPGDVRLPAHFGHYQPWHGYSDHMHGIAACLAAVARGARYIEKHFCLGKDDLTVRDTPFSATPGEFSELTRLGRELERFLYAPAIQRPS